MAGRTGARMPRYDIPSYDEEAALIAAGYARVAGLDEVGRGTIAGPVVAGAVVLPAHPKGDWVGLIRDSKQLTARRRERALDGMLAAGATVRTGKASAAEVDALGIVAATRTAMGRALAALPGAADALVIDALALPDVDLPQRVIVKGDAKCVSIAAASIAAKVARDAMMRDADAVYPGYGFGRHKGYATREHLDCLERLGACALHRRTFAPVRRVMEGLL